MKVEQITVHASRTFNNPFGGGNTRGRYPEDNWSNLKPGLSITANLEDGDEYEKVVVELQEKAETMIEAHKERILDHYEQKSRVEQIEVSLEQTKRQIQNQKTRLEELEKEHDELMNVKPLLPEAQEENN